jgi:predicted GTPase
MLLNPLSGILNEAKTYAEDKVLDLTLPRLNNWLLELYVQKVAEYAILLYSGRLAVSTDKLTALSNLSQQDQKLAQDQATGPQEPLRILVAGQINAGKSSLINHLFAQKLAATDVLSCTQDIQPYQLEREGLQTGLIFDTPGYGETSSWLDKNLSIVDNTDLLLLVCAAHQSARLADRRFLATFQQHFQQHTQRKLPPIIVVVNHIDVLRPTREWQPPYDLTNPHPDSEKAKNILAAIAAIQTELALSPDTAIIPISLGDNAGLGAYNLEALILAMSQQMDDAHLTRLLRCLNTAKNRAKWPQLWQQLSNSGRWLVKSVDNVL